MYGFIYACVLCICMRARVTQYIDTLTYVCILFINVYTQITVYMYIQCTYTCIHKTHVYVCIHIFIYICTVIYSIYGCVCVTFFRCLYCLIYALSYNSVMHQECRSIRLQRVVYALRCVLIDLLFSVCDAVIQQSVNSGSSPCLLRLLSLRRCGLDAQ
jgi:hypothetical protein